MPQVRPPNGLETLAESPVLNPCAVSVVIVATPFVREACVITRNILYSPDVDGSARSGGASSSGIGSPNP